MATSVNRTGEYDQYLDRLVNEAQRLHADFENFIELWGLLDEFNDEVNEAPGTFKAFINGLKTSTVVLSHRLFDKGSIGLPALIDFAEKHKEEIGWERAAPTQAEFDDQRARIERLGDVLDRLRKARNKAYAHLDKSAVLDPEKFAQEFPLDQDDIRSAIALSHEILQEHVLARENKTLGMTIGGAVEVKHILQLIRDGVECREMHR